MKYKPELGFFKNMERAFSELTKTNNKVFNTQSEVEQIDGRVSASETVNSIAFVTLAESGQIDDVTASEHPEMFEDWKTDIQYKAGHLRKYNGLLYRCISDHTSQIDWTPDVSVSLWVLTSDPAEEFPAWSQPVGAHDAYMTGDKVTHKDKHWISTVDNNTWEPDVYGWEQVVE